MGHGLTGRAAEECRIEPRFLFSSANSVTILQVRIFRIIAKLCLVMIPVQSVSMRGHGTMRCWPPAGHPDPYTGLDEKNLDLVLKSASLFYQIICMYVSVSCISDIAHRT